MDAQAGMLAQLFGRSMGARPRTGGVRHLVRGAPQRPECGKRCGTCDARERT